MRFGRWAQILNRWRFRLARSGQKLQGLRVCLGDWLRWLLRVVQRLRLSKPLKQAGWLAATWRNALARGLWSVVLRLAWRTLKKY